MGHVWENFGWFCLHMVTHTGTTVDGARTHRQPRALPSASNNQPPTSRGDCAGSHWRITMCPSGHADRNDEIPPSILTLNWEGSSATLRGDTPQQEKKQAAQGTVRFLRLLSCRCVFLVFFAYIPVRCSIFLVVRPLLFWYYMTYAPVASGLCRYHEHT